MKALVIGVSSYDTLIYVDSIPDLRDDITIFADKINYSIGGTGAGKALALATLGVSTTLVTDLGNDDTKEKVLRFLNVKNLQVKVLSSDKTTTHTNIMHDHNKRMSIFTSVPSKVEFDSTIEKNIIENDLIFLNINDYCRKYIPIIKKHNKITVVDIHDYDDSNPYHEDFIKAADVLFVSGVNIKNHKDFLRKNIKGKQAVIITKSDQGSIAIDARQQIFEEKAYVFDSVIDTNGAGDSFSVGFMFEYIRSKSITKALKYGSVCGGLACQSQLLYNPIATASYMDSLIDLDK